MSVPRDDSKTERVPTWHREAIERGIGFIVLVYEKAEGFVFCPGNLAQPFRVGGDYAGCLPTDAAGALYHVRNRVSPAFMNQLQWFVPFLEKAARGTDFSLDSLRLDTRPAVRVINGRWPW